MISNFKTFHTYLIARMLTSCHACTHAHSYTHSYTQIYSTYDKWHTCKYLMEIIHLICKSGLELHDTDYACLPI